MKSKIKITIRLSDEQSQSFPISTESLWFEKNDDLYRLKNIPFFIDDLSFGDIITINKLNDDEYEIDQIVTPSKNSTIWIYLQNESLGKDVVKKINVLGCGVESGVFDNYYAINIPSDIDFNIIYKLINNSVADDILIADYPSTRHEFNG